MTIDEFGLKSISSIISMIVWGNSTVDECSSLNILTDPTASIFQTFVQDVQNNKYDKNFIKKIEEIINEEINRSEVYKDNNYEKKIRKLFNELIYSNEEYELLFLILQNLKKYKN